MFESGDVVDEAVPVATREFWWAYPPKQSIKPPN